MIALCSWMPFLSQLQEKLRSVEDDLEDLDETIAQVLRNGLEKFNLTRKVKTEVEGVGLIFPITCCRGYYQRATKVHSKHNGTSRSDS